MSGILEEFADVVGVQPPSQYVLKRLIGKGSFASVYQMVETATSRLVVGKFMDLSLMPEKNRQFALSEAKNSAESVHPNIIEFIRSHVSQRNAQYLLLVLEYADGGDLSVQVSVRAPYMAHFKETEVLMITAQVGLALKYLHDRNVLHRDVKTQNVFLTTSGLIKLGDFGLSRQYEQDVESSYVGSTFCGTPYYLSPEVWAQSSYNSKADMWSLGVVMYELMALRRPFVASTMKDLYAKISSGVFDPLPSFYSAEIQAMVHSLLSVNVEERLSISELLVHPLMQSLGLLALKRNLPRLVAVDEATKVKLQKVIDDVLVDEVPEGAQSTAASVVTASGAT